METKIARYAVLIPSISMHICYKRCIKYMNKPFNIHIHLWRDKLQLWNHDLFDHRLSVKCLERIFFVLFWFYQSKRCSGIKPCLATKISYTSFFHCGCLYFIITCSIQKGNWQKWESIGKGIKWNKFFGCCCWNNFIIVVVVVAVANLLLFLKFRFLLLSVETIH